MLSRSPYLLFALAALAAHGDQDLRNQDRKVFERVFGISRVIPAEIVERVKALPAGERLEIDRNEDGVIDELIYIDTDKRHTIQPMLVWVIDEDGDLAETGRPDRDSDCYFWDHHADGYIDVVTDYVDDDGDGDLDQMGIYYNKNWNDDIDDLTVWWSVDIGDDNLLWYDVNGNYYQPLCQWRTHFSGDELFYQFRLTEEDEKWVNVWEDPFAFYDPDGDRASEMVIRISAIGDDVKNLRYSIDADNDAHGANTHNYEFSVTALPPAEGLVTTEWNGPPLTIRGIETLPLLGWDKTAAFSQQAKWGSAMLTWDEINSNTDEKPEQDPNERWEGVLNHASKHGDFEQVGGPPSSAYNKRVEVSHAPASPLRLYWDASDQRYHLLGAAYGYMDVDFDLDGTVDAYYTWKDADGDGVLDVKEADVDGDGTVDMSWPLTGVAMEAPLTVEAFQDHWPAAMNAALRHDLAFIDAAEAALGAMPDNAMKVVDYFRDELPAYHRERAIGERIRTTDGGNLFYAGLVRDRMFAALADRFGGEAEWTAFAETYAKQDFAGAAKMIEDALGEATTEAKSGELVLTFPPYTGGPTVTGRPHSWTVAELKAQDPDFDPETLRVIGGEHRLVDIAIPHQIDDWNFDGVPSVHVLDRPEKLAGASNTLRFVYGGKAPAFPKLTNAVLDNPAYVAWESDAGAFRFYTGQFDFFGKHQDRLIPREDMLIYPLVDVNYHAEQDWGIDALHVGKTSGLGGLTLYWNGKEYPVQSPAGEGDVVFEHEVLGSGPVRSAVEIRAKNVVAEHPDAVVRIRCYIYAGHEETEVVVALPEELKGARIAPGLMRLEEDGPFADAALGLMGTWGYQGDDIGEIGMAVIVPPAQLDEIAELDHECRAICRTEDGMFRYWIVGGWRRGMQYPIGADGQTWQEKTTTLARETAEMK